MCCCRSVRRYDGDGEPNSDSAACEVYWGQTPIDSKQLLERGQKKLEELIEDIGGPENITEDNFPKSISAATSIRRISASAG
jgi:hypothetical protein